MSFHDFDTIKELGKGCLHIFLLLRVLKKNIFIK